MDIVGGAVGSLCEAWRAVARSEASGLWINLLFDYAGAAVRVESPYTGSCLRIAPGRPGPLWVRVPPWVATDSLVISEPAGSYRRVGAYLFFPAPAVGKPIEIAFPLVARQIILKHRAHDIRVRMRGDAVAAMDDFGADLTFFEPLS